MSHFIKKKKTFSQETQCKDFSSFVREKMLKNEGETRKDSRYVYVGVCLSVMKKANRQDVFPKGLA